MDYRRKKRRAPRRGRAAAVGTFATALDKASARRYDDNGYLHVDGCTLTREAVDEYYGREIVGAAALGLEEARRYRVFRPGAELAKALETANRIPVLDRHDGRFDAEHYDNANVVGAVGSDARYEQPYVKNSIAIHDKDVIRDIETGRRDQLSCGYRYRPVMEAGVFEGEPYDIRMADIRFNHVALVKTARSGDDVRVADSAADIDADGHADPNGDSREAEIAKLRREIAALQTRLAEFEQQDGVDDDADGDPPGESSDDPADVSSGDPSEIPPDDNGEDDERVDQADSAAMDSAAVASLLEKAIEEERLRQRRRDEAIREAAPLLDGGEAKLLALDSAEDVYRYCLKQRRVETPCGMGLDGLRGMVAAFVAGLAERAGQPAPEHGRIENAVAGLIKKAGIAVR